MANVKVVDIHGKKTGDLELDEAVFGVKVNMHVIRESLSQFLVHQRIGTASTKTRSEVAGGGEKPWRQKGTGRARAGTRSSPIWRHGGVTFGPKPRSYSFKVNKKKKRLALYSVLSSLARDNKIFVVKEIVLSEPKTRRLVECLETLGLEGKTLLLLESPSREILLSARNLPSVKVLPVDNINIFDLLNHDNLVTTPETVKKMEETLK